jgi:hypothetical protein
MQGAYNGTRRPALPEGCRVGGDVVERVEALLDVPQHRQEVLLRVRWVEIRLRGVHGRLLRVPLRLENVRRLALRGCEVRRPAIGAPPALSETLAHRGEFGLVLGCIALLL